MLENRPAIATAHAPPCRLAQTLLLL